MFWHWFTLIWFTSFHTLGSTMLTNKRNMLIETVAVMFLAPRSDVHQLRRCTSEANEHTYGMLWQMLREFNTEQFIRLVDKLRICLDAIFESELLTSRNQSKGYLASFPDFVKSLMSGSKHPLAGPFDVDLSKAAVDQLWDKVNEVINTVNRVCRPLLKKFGVEEGNGLSSFAVDMHEPNDLLSLFTLFCQKPPKRDPRDMKQNLVGGVDADEDHGDSGDEGGKGEGDSTGSDLMEIPSEVLKDMIDELEACDETVTTGEGIEEKKEDENGNQLDASALLHDIELSFAAGDASKAFMEFKEMLKPGKTVEEIGIHALKMMELMQLGDLEKGSEKMDLKFKSLQSRWYGCKLKKPDHIKSVCLRAASMLQGIVSSLYL
jgi:hypothetical protein